MNTLRCLQQSCYLALPPRLATLIKSPYYLYQTFKTLCMIWYNLHNLKNVKNKYIGVILLVKLQASAVTLVHGCFLHFLSRANDTKSREASHLFMTAVIHKVKQ